MSRLFAEAFLVPPSDDGSPVELPVYDEKRAINLDRVGRPFVEVASAGETHTLTEVRGERDDRDRADEDAALGLGTITKVAGEGADRSDALAAKPSGGTAVGWTDTQTFMRREGADIAADW